jgi:septal ring factor EnvC (AmiA/AmiB activator)
VNHILTRMIDKYAETISALRAHLGRHVPEHVSAYRADYSRVDVPASELARAADQLAEARRTIEQGMEREAKLHDRISRLESRTGALMVDRDRGVREAGQRAEGAWRVAADSLAALRDAGIEPDGDLATLVADATRYGDHVFGLLDRERERLDAFRRSIVGLIQQCQTHSADGKGLSPEQVGKLGQSIDRANDKACGR